jgi:hypothetical protein
VRNGVKIKRSIASYMVAMVHSTKLSDEASDRERQKTEQQAEKKRLAQQQLVHDKNTAAKSALLEQYENDRRAVLLATFRKSADLYKQYLVHLKTSQEKPGLGTTMSGIVASQLSIAMNGDTTKEAFLQALTGAGYGLLYSDVMHWFERHSPQILSPVRDKYAAVAQSLGVTIH